jgi:hypothetical protein
VARLTECVHETAKDMIEWLMKVNQLAAQQDNEVAPEVGEPEPQSAGRIKADQFGTLGLAGVESSGSDNEFR